MKEKRDRWITSLRNRWKRWLGINKELRHTLDWLDINAQLELINDNTIVIGKNKNVLFLKLSKPERKVTLSFKNKILKEFVVTPSNGDFIINKNDEQLIMKNQILFHLTEYEFFRELDIEKTMVLPFIIQGQYRDTDKEYWKRLQPDINLLINDKKFYRIVNKGVSDLHRGYQNMLEYRNR